MKLSSLLLWGVGGYLVYKHFVAPAAAVPVLVTATPAALPSTPTIAYSAPVSQPVSSSGGATGSF